MLYNNNIHFNSLYLLYSVTSAALLHNSVGPLAWRCHLKLSIIVIAIINNDNFIGFIWNSLLWAYPQYYMYTYTHYGSCCTNTVATWYVSLYLNVCHSCTRHGWCCAKRYNTFLPSIFTRWNITLVPDSTLPKLKTTHPTSQFSLVSITLVTLVSALESSNHNTLPYRQHHIE